MTAQHRYFDDPEFKPTVGVGSFVDQSGNDYKDRVKATYESFTNQLQCNPNYNLVNILTTEALFKQYKDDLFGDMLEPGQESSFDFYAKQGGVTDDYTAMHTQKMDALIENSRRSLVDEASTVGMLSPIVAATMPILKKEYILNQFKDMVHTIVTPTPIIKYTYQRRFLKDAAGNKKYFPECYYDGSYAEFTDRSVGMKVSSKWYPESGNMPIAQLNMLEESGGSLSRRDALGLDFSVMAVKVKVPSDANAAGEEVIIDHLDIRPDYGTNSFNKQVEIPSKVQAVTEPTVIFVFGMIDFYSGIVNISVVSDNTNVDCSTAKVQFGGHLSNANNDAIIELDKERKNDQFTISEKERFNGGLTLEKIKDEKALANIDVTIELVSDMSDVAAQTTDSNLKRYLEDSFVNTQQIEQSRVFQPMGYNFVFADKYEFDMEAPGPYMVTEAEWRSRQLRYYFERVLAYLKLKLRDERVMFCCSCNTFVAELLSATDNGIKWVLDSNANIGGVKLDYKFGVITVNGTRVQFIVSQKETVEKGFRIVTIPLTDTVITYRHYLYSFSIESNYRNPITPNIPNIMCVQRYENVEVLPIQSNFYVKQYREGNFMLGGPQETYKNWMRVNGLL